MSTIVFPTATVIANAIPTNGNTVPLSGLHALTTHTESFLYFALALENIQLSDNINFGNITLPSMNISKVSTSGGDLYLNVNGFVKMKPNYSTFADGAKLWKQCIERLPNNPANSGFNF